MNRLPRLPPTRAPWADEADPTETDEQEELDDEDGLGDLALRYISQPTSDRITSANDAASHPHLHLDNKTSPLSPHQPTSPQHSKSNLQDQTLPSECTSLHRHLRRTLRGRKRRRCWCVIMEPERVV